MGRKEKRYVWRNSSNQFKSGAESIPYSIFIVYPYFEVVVFIFYHAWRNNQLIQFYSLGCDVNMISLWSIGWLFLRYKIYIYNNTAVIYEKCVLDWMWKRGMLAIMQSWKFGPYGGNDSAFRLHRVQVFFALEFFRINGAAWLCTSVFSLASWIILSLSVSWQQPQGSQVLRGWIPRLW